MAKAPRGIDQICVIIRSAREHGSPPNWLEIICSRAGSQNGGYGGLIEADPPPILFALRPELLALLISSQAHWRVRFRHAVVTPLAIRGTQRGNYRGESD
jgi:hypothetical protein